ncbi:hypothetical protein [Desulfovibrio intestinalis]|uniref:Uncharacterized protein n=1 Tax=Desulfovibrio intestinalis TaxID=58621 RepID=A0A7W8C5I6_9BACT|nr:hypothetical protein [Desulfovibrio intestinalis]MBB5144135.1 hypothetical protein [Desulfovibrio intestinalis]
MTAQSLLPPVGARRAAKCRGKSLSAFQAWRASDKITFEMLYILNLSSCRKMQFSKESMPRCVAAHSRAAVEPLNLLEAKAL